MFDNNFDPIWDTYYAARLTKYETNQFRKASHRTSSQLLDAIIKPLAYQPDKGTYLCIAQSMEVTGRSYFHAKSVVEAGGALDWTVNQFFTNGMRIAQPGDPDFNHPSDRVTMVPYQVFTFEYDSASLPFFKQQLSWFRSVNKPPEAPIGKFLKDIRAQFKDCVGLSVVYSGNKSFHYHLVFSTDLIGGRVEQPTSVRHGFAQAWDRLAEMMRTSPHLQIPAGFEADPTTRHPEWFRRLPNGARPLRAPHGKADWQQFFGVPEGEIVPQVVMWENITLDRSGRGANPTSVFLPSDFTLTTIPSHQRKGSATKVPMEFNRSSAVEQFCGAKLAAIYPGFRDNGTQQWPQFVGFQRHRASDEVRAFFANSPTDRHPASYMGEAFSTVFIQGDNPYCLTNAGEQRMPRLRKPLGEMIEMWTAEYEAIHNPPTVEAPAALDRPRTALEQRFAAEAITYADATTAIARVLDDLVLSNPGVRETHFLSAPEGVSKTRSLIASTPRYVYHQHLQQRPTLTLYAFASYEMAEEKCAEFNATHSKNVLIFNSRYIGVVLPSFSHLYEDVCRKLNMAPFTIQDAASRGFGSLMAAISAIQPEVLTQFRRFYREMWAQIADRQPVLFGVHQVAHGWIKNSPTRLMFCPAYWTGQPDEEASERAARMARCRNFTALGLLIHDEVSADNLLLSAPRKLVDWVEAMRLQSPSSWTADSPLAEKFEAFEAFRLMAPPPVDCSYELACEIAEVETWDMVTTGHSAEYGVRQDRIDLTTGTVYPDIYAATAGHEWCICVREWPTQAASKTLVLTTESVPAHIVRKIATGWTVTELDTPLIARDVVDTYPSRDVTAANLGRLVKEWQDAYEAEHGRPLAAISNKAKHVANTRTHVGAKGSNSYMGQDVIQTMSMMPPEQYEFYEALNAWTQRTDMVRTRHMDEFQQTCGRNLGFRKRGEPRHILLINSKLNECLEGEPKARARYVMQEVLSRRQVANAKTAAKSVPTGPRPSQTRLKEMSALLQAQHAST